MPTPSGKPKVGEKILHVASGIEGKVLRRSDGLQWSLYIRWEDPAKGTLPAEGWITEAQWWIDHDVIRVIG